MKSVTVKNRFVKVAPRKIRSILSLTRNKAPLEAIEQIRFMPRSGADEVVKLIKAGISAAKASDISEENSIISSAIANEGKSLKRRWLRAKGMATTIKKTSSHAWLTITEINSKNTKKDYHGT